MSEVSPQTTDFIRKDKEYSAPALKRVFPIVAASAKGSYIHAIDGQKYLDLTAGIGVNQLGHCHPEIVETIQRQAAELIHVSVVSYHQRNAELAKSLSAVAPMEEAQSFFCNSGAEAVEGAIKLAKQANKGRPNIVAFRGSFHGRTMGATSLSSSKTIYRSHYDPLLAGVHFYDYPNCWNCPVFKEPSTCSLECLEQLKRSFKQNLPPESIAAIIIEPVLGEGGYVPLPNHRHNYFQELRSLCDQHGILLIADEVQSGIGRTGRWFASEHYGVIPDILCLAKGLGSGMPIGAFVAGRQLMSQMLPGSHGSTYGGNPIACAVAHKTLEILERDDLIPHVAQTGTELMNFLQTELGSLAQVRGYGYMIGLQFASSEQVEKIISSCFAQGVLLLSCGTYNDTLRLIPSLNISREDLWQGANIILKAAKESTK